MVNYMAQLSFSTKCCTDQGRSVTAMAGKCSLVIISLLLTFVIAYDAQSGSKDRGDPQVRALSVHSPAE